MENVELNNLFLASNFTIKPVNNVMNYWLDSYQVKSSIHFSEAYSFISKLYDKKSEFYDTSNFSSVIFFRYENCYAGSQSIDLSLSVVESFSNELFDALEYASLNGSVPILLIEAPSSDALNINTSDLRNELKTKLKQLDNVHFEPQETLFSLYPSCQYFNEYEYATTLMPYSRECYTALGTIASRLIVSRKIKPKKVLVLDCDNTLWGGVVGEDGVENLVLNHDYIGLQDFVVKLHDKGILLCLCSKNTEQDVWAAFDYHQGKMPLQKSHIVSHGINWDLKSSNIIRLANELNLGLDSFIFIDDNPTEICEVQSACPEVTCLQLPDNSNDIMLFLQHQWALDVPAVSKADASRTRFYQKDKLRKAEQSKFTSHEEFLAHLNLELNIYEISDESIARACQLSVRTNQFNFSGIQFDRAQASQRIGSSTSKCMLVSVKDRFGEYGEVGCIFYRIECDSIVVENFLLSCRALGKNVEKKMWDWLCNRAEEKGLGKIDVLFKPTARNKPAENFLKSIEFNRFNEGDVLRHSLF
ncbi:HAD-IIIC family phosphatase [Pseudoalteromonas umbrosa]|uniref:HAD-IIIC family phosphatase n=1 Tax=Pseudoalteromonas umbrosa TaxID=3048489 RepID=UPI0024C3D38E|nr:HAD-IIIC family phosphatase [Pseudoalteromonas sp. B95]MDK1288216.1 HAD-IIIC family phosphatase [Pseudoalteromonas sp. B95]